VRDIVPLPLAPAGGGGEARAGWAALAAMAPLTALIPDPPPAAHCRRPCLALALFLEFVGWQTWRSCGRWRLMALRLRDQ
jgi:hypothetical protein